jgi:hypothetical protein
MSDTAAPETAAAATTPAATASADTDNDTDAAANNNNNNNTKTKKNAAATRKQKPPKPPDYNPRWKGYVYIGIASLINFCSISNIPAGDYKYSRSYWVSSMCFGVLTFTLAILVLIQDRSHKCLKPFYYTNAKDGYFEGYTLCGCVVWWIIGYVNKCLLLCEGMVWCRLRRTHYSLTITLPSSFIVSYLYSVGCITRVNGIAYVANNVYFTAWLSLIACIYTLNQWSESKDILCIAELTGISATLKSWYLLCLSSIVVLGTSIDLYVTLNQQNQQDTAFGVVLGAVSTCVALFFILVHYNFITGVEEGGWLELSSSFFLIMLWIIGVAILTQNQGIAATLTGTQCGRDERELFEDPDCAIVLVASNNETSGIIIVDSIECSELPRQVPGSNMYFAVWTAFAASINISFRWKAAQALQFAQAQEQKAKQAQLVGGEAGGNGEEDNNIAQEGDSEDDEVDEDAI